MAALNRAGHVSCDFLVERNFREGKCSSMGLRRLWGGGHPLLLTLVQVDHTEEKPATAGLYILSKKREFHNYSFRSKEEGQGHFFSLKNLRLYWRFTMESHEPIGSCQ